MNDFGCSQVLHSIGTLNRSFQTGAFLKDLQQKCIWRAFVWDLTWIRTKHSNIAEICSSMLTTRKYTLHNDYKNYFLD